MDPALSPTINLESLEAHTESCDIVWISTEARDVLLDPKERISLIYNTPIAWA
jgi:hypothetical protein